MMGLSIKNKSLQNIIKSITVDCLWSQTKSGLLSLDKKAYIKAQSIKVQLND